MEVDPKTLRLLVVEDEGLIAMLVADMIDDAGWQIVGPADNVDTALDLIASCSIDGAVLDVHLVNGERSHPVASVLRERGIPFFFASGRGVDAQTPGFEQVPILNKPFRYREFIAAVERYIHR